MKPRIVKVVQGVHMGLNHLGLQKLLKKEVGIDVHKLEPWEMVLCMNTKGDKMKFVWHQGSEKACKQRRCLGGLGYIRVQSGLIMREAIQYLPETFGGQGFNYDAACEKALTKRFASYPQRRNPLQVAEAARSAGVQ